ncbi:MAG TPA: HAD hydrolase-like protein [Cytophagaceae bacterium]|jgi:phosphoglycolate phosphatase
MKIFFDLDGTLLDSKRRVYSLFQYLVPNSTFSFVEYWNLKQNKVGHQQILTEIFGYREDQFKTFEDEWLRLIEDPEWLKLDTPFEGLKRYLLNLKTRNSLYVVTARQFKAVVQQQLNSFELIDIFEEILVTEQKRGKAELIGELVLTGDDWIVGDTGYDIEVGKRLGLRTGAVLSGFLNKENLKEYGPDIIVENVTDLIFD